jgi:leader peptidase (prepilin peptidase)/N-methyltransferase
MIMTDIQSLLWPAVVFAFAFGSIIGSFCNVLAWRVPNGMSVTNPKRSFCPVCKHQLAWHDNIPIIAWLALRGRCRYCHAGISVRYPLMEVLYGVEFAGLTAAAFTGLIPFAVLPAALFAVIAMTTMAVIDADTHYVYDRMVDWSAGVLAVLLAVASALAGDWWALLHALFGALAFFGVYLLMYLWFTFVRRIEGMGAGDVGVAIIVGGMLGWLGLYQSIVGFFSIFLSAAVFALLAWLLKTVSHGRFTALLFDEEGRMALPHVPFMTAGMVIGMLSGAAVVWWFLAANGLTMFY